ncbi:unnamed protein product [Rhizophagus irregularis]|nr:unnamed protein product [Rhizophagus irregularis]
MAQLHDKIIILDVLDSEILKKLHAVYLEFPERKRIILLDLNWTLLLKHFHQKSRAYYKAEVLKSFLKNCKKDEYSTRLGKLACEILTTGIRAATGAVRPNFHL